MQLACWALLHLSSCPLHMLHWGLEENCLNDSPRRDGQQRPSKHSVDDPEQRHAYMFPVKNGVRSLQSCTALLDVCRWKLAVGSQLYLHGLQSHSLLWALLLRQAQRRHRHCPGLGLRQAHGHWTLALLGALALTALEAL